jgi:molybdopterin synthase sulfur carrier subunit
MIKVLYFASIRERLDCSEEELEAGDNTLTFALLKDLLARRGDQWKTVFSDKNNLLSSVNQVIAKDNQTINDGDEVAFFPQVTGG